MKRALWLVAVATFVVLVAGASPAGAELSGPCQAQGVIQETGLAIDPSTSSGPFEVPLEGTVEWFGQIGTTGEDSEERSTDGAIEVVAPPGFEELLGTLLEARDWGDDDAVSTAESDVDGYELPSLTPRDTEILVRGFHNDELGNCDGEVVVIVEGNALDSPLAIGSLVGTVVTGAGVVVAGLAKGGR